MNKHKWFALLAVALLVLLLAGNVLAMSSSSYVLDWYVPGAGGGEASSANYAVNFTAGQSVIGTSSSTNYGSGLGYWYGLMLEWLSYLPVVFK
jgi:multisubunit Na+/H+ antiporter MnhB subunit